MNERAAEGNAIKDRIVTWLMDRRAQLEARARAAGLPMAVMVSVPIGEVTDHGLTTRTEARPLSVFSFSTLSVRVGTPLLDDQGERLAAELVARYGDGIKFLCRYGPGNLRNDMEHPDLAEQPDVSLQFNNLEQSMLAWTPMFYALILLRQCALEYVSHLASLDSDEGEVARRLATELLDFCADDAVTHLARVPLAGIDITEPEVASSDCVLKRLSGEELGLLSSERHLPWTTTRTSRSLPATMAPWTHHIERIVLEVRQTGPKTQLYNPAVYCQKVLLALHLMGVEYAGAGFGAMLEEPIWIQNTGRSVYPLLMPQLIVTSITTVNTELLANILDLVQGIPDEAVQGPTSPADLALRRICLGMSKLDAGDAVIDYAVALEALFLQSSDVSEARRRFALHGAVYTARTAAARRRAYDDLMEIYHARSMLVHGVDPTTRRAKDLPARLPWVRVRAAELVRLAVRRALHSRWPTEQDFTDALLDEAPNLDLTLP